MVGWVRKLVIGCTAVLLLLGTTASASISPKIASKPNIHQVVDLNFSAPVLPEGGYYYGVMVLESYGHYTREHPPPCSVSSDMQRTEYGYPAGGTVSLSLSLTPAKSHTGHWCLGGSYEGAIYAIPHAPPCEGGYSCYSPPPEECLGGLPPPCVRNGVVARPRAWTYPDKVPPPSSKGGKIVGWFVVRFRSHHQSRLSRTSDPR